MTIKPSLFQARSHQWNLCHLFNSQSCRTKLGPMETSYHEIFRLCTPKSSDNVYFVLTFVHLSWNVAQYFIIFVLSLSLKTLSFLEYRAGRLPRDLSEMGFWKGMSFWKGVCEMDPIQKFTCLFCFIFYWCFLWLTNTSYIHVQPVQVVPLSQLCQMFGALLKIAINVIIHSIPKI